MRYLFLNNALWGPDRDKYAHAKVLEYGELESCKIEGKNPLWLKGKADVHKVEMGRQTPKGIEARMQVNIHMVLFRVPVCKLDLLIYFNDPFDCRFRIPLEGESCTWTEQNFWEMAKTFQWKRDLDCSDNVYRGMWYRAVFGY